MSKVTNEKIRKKISPVLCYMPASSNANQVEERTAPSNTHVHTNLSRRECRHTHIVIIPWTANIHRLGGIHPITNEQQHLSPV